ARPLAYRECDTLQQLTAETRPPSCVDLIEQIHQSVPTKGPATPCSNQISGRNLTDTLLGLNLSNLNDKGAFIGGGQLGFNYQFGNFVLGVEGDIDGVANTNSPGNGVVGPPFGTILVTSTNKWIATLASRFGVTNDTWLFYGKAGGGWVGYDNLTIT